MLLMWTPGSYFSLVSSEGHIWIYLETNGFRANSWDAGRSHRVFVVVDNRQVEHQGTMVETSGVLQGGKIFVLFNSGASDSFISPFVVV